MGVILEFNGVKNANGRRIFPATACVALAIRIRLPKSQQRLAPQQLQQITLYWRERRTGSIAFAPHRPIGPFAIFGMPLCQPRIAALCPRRIFEHQCKPDGKQDQPARPRQPADQGCENYQKPADTNQCPLHGGIVSQLFGARHEGGCGRRVTLVQGIAVRICLPVAHFEASLPPCALTASGAEPPISCLTTAKSGAVNPVQISGSTFP
jgi:hypothetical protein